jgi:hypothetical protein
VHRVGSIPQLKTTEIIVARGFLAVTEVVQTFKPILQRKKLGFFPLKTKANGIMGPTTVASLKKLQAKYKIKENGLGAKTRALLNSLN